MKKKLKSANIKDKMKNIKKKETKQSKLSTFKEKILTKKNIVYLIILIVDIAFTIYAARGTNANYVTVNNKTKFIGDSTKLVFGKNYITLFTTFIVYIYYIILNKFYFKEKKGIYTLIIVPFALLAINCLVFFLFINKIY